MALRWNDFIGDGGDGAGVAAYTSWIERDAAMEAPGLL
jgi:hypothetical protein